MGDLPSSSQNASRMLASCSLYWPLIMMTVTCLKKKAWFIRGWTRCCVIITLPFLQDDTSFSVLQSISSEIIAVCRIFPFPWADNCQNHFTRVPRLCLSDTFNMEQTSFYITVHGYGQYVDLQKAEKAGLVNPPPMESSLASHGWPHYCLIQALQVVCFSVGEDL